MPGRYRKQELFHGLGRSGQAAVSGKSVMVAGAGATGGTMALLLVRAGVKRLRLVDRDFPEEGNLGRQLLYDEDDLKSGLPKAVAAREKLRRMNSDVQIEGMTADINPGNILELAAGMDLILDGLDNQETRYLINDAAVRTGVPWIYAGCIGAAGNVMPIIPGRTPCLRCIFPQPAPPGSLPTCDTAGIIGPAPSLVASVAASEALKILSGQSERILPGLFVYDLWHNAYRVVELPRGKDLDCPCCGRGNFEFLEGIHHAATETMCGVDAVQITPAADTHSRGRKLNLEGLAGQMDPEAIITLNEYLLRFEAEGYRFSVFPDGRVIIHGLSDHAVARSLYDRFIGF